jgi:hypothetical protein
MALFVRGWKRWCIGGALTGVGYALIQGAPMAIGACRPLLFVAGLAALILGIRILWTALMQARDEDDDRRKPPSILP